ncbi:MAG: leucine-rich repeat domain-containing protein [Treponema sp.]|nr:leucine-rich repeat domain-containing protein [Treponema sp.]
MKNRTKWKAIRQIAGIIAFTAIIGFLTLACGGNETTGKTQLGTPANLMVDDNGNKSAFILQWDGVTGADRYELDISGELKQLSSLTTQYDLKDLTNDPKEYHIRIRALAANGDAVYKDSAYSSPLKVETADFVFEYDEIAVTPNIQSRSAARAVGGGYKISGLTPFGNNLERVVIPPKIGNTEITAIGNNAFAGNETMKSVVLPNTLTDIGDSAFAGTKIESIQIPESVTNVGNNAFKNCIVLVVVIFVAETPPDLGSGVFEGASAINEIVVPEGKSETFVSAIRDSTPQLASTIEDIITTRIITSIAVTTNPTKNTYITGEALNTNGIVVTATYSDKSTSVIYSGLSYTPTTLNTTGTITITVSYISWTATFTVTVTAAPAGGQDPAVNGTWIGKGYWGWADPDGQSVTYEYEIELTLNNGSYQWNEDGNQFMKGTYTASGGKMTYKTTEVYLDSEFIGGSEDQPGNEGGRSVNARNTDTGKWYTRAEAKELLLKLGLTAAEAEEELDEFFIQGTGTYNTNGSELSLIANGERHDFTRKGATPTPASYNITVNVPEEFSECVKISTYPGSSASEGKEIIIHLEVLKTGYELDFEESSIKVGSSGANVPWYREPINGSIAFKMPAGDVIINAVVYYDPSLADYGPGGNEING